MEQELPNTQPSKKTTKRTEEGAIRAKTLADSRGILTEVIDSAVVDMVDWVTKHYILPNYDSMSGLKETNKFLFEASQFESMVRTNSRLKRIWDSDIFQKAIKEVSPPKVWKRGGLLRKLLEFLYNNPKVYSNAFYKFYNSGKGSWASVKEKQLDIAHHGTTEKIKMLHSRLSDPDQMPGDFEEGKESAESLGFTEKNLHPDIVAHYNELHPGARNRFKEAIQYYNLLHEEDPNFRPYGSYEFVFEDDPKTIYEPAKRSVDHGRKVVVQHLDAAGRAVKAYLLKKFFLTK